MSFAVHPRDQGRHIGNVRNNNKRTECCQMKYEQTGIPDIIYVMSKYPFSQLIREIFTQARGLFTQLYKHIASKLNEGIDKNFLTHPGGATMSDFFVAPPWRRVYACVVASRNPGHSRGLQLGKEGI